MYKNTRCLPLSFRSDQSVGISTVVNTWLPGIAGPSPSATLDKGHMFFHLIVKQYSERINGRQYYF